MGLTPPTPTSALKGLEANQSAVLIAKEHRRLHMRAETKKILEEAKLRQCEHGCKYKCGLSRALLQHLAKQRTTPTGQCVYKKLALLLR